MKNTLYIVFILTLSCKQDKRFSLAENESDQGKTSVQSKVKLSPKEFLLWYENPENKMITEKTIGDFSYSCFYKEAGYLAIKEWSNDSLKNDIKEKIKEYEGMQYFSYKIQSLSSQDELLKIGISSEDEYYSRIEYLSFKMQKDFKLIDGTDTLDCKLFHFERNYGLAPNASFTLAFEKGKRNNNSKSLIYEDKVFGNGTIYLTIKENDLNNIPKISI